MDHTIQRGVVLQFFGVLLACGIDGWDRWGDGMAVLRGCLLSCAVSVNVNAAAAPKQSTGCLQDKMQLINS